MFIIKLYKMIEDIWFRIDQKIRFLLVGGFNTVLSYLIYAFLIVMCRMPYIASLVLQYIVTVNISIITMRYYVFRSKGDFCKEYCKAWSVYLLTLLMNSVGLTFLVEICRINELWAQGIYQVAAAILTYLLHKYFSFHKK